MVSLISEIQDYILEEPKGWTVGVVWFRGVDKGTVHVLNGCIGGTGYGFVHRQPSGVKLS